MLTRDQAWKVLETVPDPEIPVISVTELGIVREVGLIDDGLEVVVTPTYSGCPATEVIADSIRDALVAAGAGRVEVSTRLSPAWTTDWITPEAREKLRVYGIVPPGERSTATSVQTIRFMQRRLECPRCGSTDTERLSEFGSTACKSTWRCKSCLEPFEYFKPI